MRRREFTTALAGVASSLAVGRSRCVRSRPSAAARRRDPRLGCERSRRTGSHRRVHASAATIGLDRRPQYPNPSSLSPTVTPTARAPTRRIGRARARRRADQWRLDHGTCAAGDPHRAGRVRGSRRSGRRRLRREPGAARRQRHGFTSYEYSMSGKWLELLKEIAPGVKRVAVLRDPAVSAGTGQFGAIQTAAPSFGVELRPINVRDAAEIERAVTEFARSGNGGLIVTTSAAVLAHRDLIITLAAWYKLPAVYYAGFYVTAGGLASYGPDYVDQYRRAAGYVDRMLKGEKPSDLPVQAPTKYDLVINLKTAQALGLDIPATVLARADEVIE